MQTTRRAAVAATGRHRADACLHEPAGGDGGPPGVQAVDLGLVLFGEALPDLAFYQAEDEQGHADDGARAAMRRLLFKNRAATASGPLNAE